MSIRQGAAVAARLSLRSDGRRFPASRLRQALPFLVLAATLPILVHRFADTDFAEVLDAVRAVALPTLLAALAATWVSFVAVGRFDGAIHRWLGTGIPERTARRVGAASVAVAQTLGFGLVTGTLARWRGLPGLPLARAAQVTAAVAVTFMAALAVCLGLAILAFGAPAGAPAWIAGIGLALVLALPLLSLVPHRMAVTLPPVALLGGLALLTAVDLAAAGTAFWLLLPDEPALTPAVVFPAFLLALAAGLVSGTPGGVGPFEITLFALLPQVPEAELLAAILCFRAIYYALPAILGAGWLALRPATASATAPAPEPLAAAPFPDDAPRAEAALVRQGELALRREGGTVFATGLTGQALVAVGDPVAGGVRGAGLALSRLARGHARLPAVYKCGARLAASLRRAGWTVLAVAEEAWIAPAAFTLEAPACRRLRRKLRAAEAAGVTVTRGGALPLAEMGRIAAEWAAARGGERGFSMGRYTATHVAGQRVYLAHAAGRLVAFVTFHEGRREWTLDLIRTAEDAPDGTVHALVARALEDARAARLPRLSLAALPLARDWPAPLARLAARHSASGLRQFKEAFAPRLETLYAAAPGRMGLALALWDVFWRVRRPLPLCHPAQDRYEHYPVARPGAGVAWHSDSPRP